LSQAKAYSKGEMCIICVDFQNKKLTVDEARRVYREMLSTLDPQHAEEVLKMLEQAEGEQREQGN